MKFKQTKSTKGFAKFLCFLLLIANILRCMFWLGKRFNLTLLFQSIVVIVSQIYLIHVYFQYQDEFPYKSESKSLCGYILNWKETLNPHNFWNWSDEFEYYKFILFFSFIMLISCYFAGFDHLFFFDTPQYREYLFHIRKTNHFHMNYKISPNPVSAVKYLAPV